MKKTTIIETVTILFVILFLYTGISKIMDYNITIEQIALSPFLPPFSKQIAIGLPMVEFLTVFLLVIPKWRLKGLYLAFSLMVCFTFYIAGILSFSEHLPCSCGGVLAEMSWPQHLMFNSSFIILASLAIFFEKRIKKESVNNLSAINPGWSMKMQNEN